MPIIKTNILDEAMSRTSNGVNFVKLLQSLGHNNHDISEAIQHLLDTPTMVSDWETIITSQAIQYLKNLEQHQ